MSIGQLSVFQISQILENIPFRHTGCSVFLRPFWRRVFLHLLNLSRISTPLSARGENGVHVFLHPIFGVAYFYTSSICRVFLHPFWCRVFLHPRGAEIRDTLYPPIGTALN